MTGKRKRTAWKTLPHRMDALQAARARGCQCRREGHCCRVSLCRLGSPLRLTMKSSQRASRQRARNNRRSRQASSRANTGVHRRRANPPALLGAQTWGTTTTMAIDRARLRISSQRWTSPPLTTALPISGKTRRLPSQRVTSGSGLGAHSIKLVARTLTYDTEVRDDANTTMSLQTRELVCPSLHEGTGDRLKLCWR